MEDRVGTEHVYSDQIAIKDGALVTRLPSKEGYSRRDNMPLLCLRRTY